MVRTASKAIRRILRTAATDGDSNVPDRELLRRFAARNDQAAFAALVKRHGGMVLGVCRRQVPTMQDAEDAFQAAFLLLARRAGPVRWHRSVANWRYTVARRLARDAR